MYSLLCIDISETGILHLKLTLCVLLLIIIVFDDRCLQNAIIYNGGPVMTTGKFPQWPIVYYLMTLIPDMMILLSDDGSGDYCVIFQN